MNSLTIEILDRIDYSECLRPQATRFLLEDLLVHGKAINLVGKPGQGRARMCEDAGRLAKSYFRVWQIDLKPHRSSYAQFLKELSHIAGLSNVPEKFEQVFEQVNTDQPILFVLDNLDYLGDGHASSSKESLDPRFDKHFIAFLNNLKNGKQPKVSLLIPSSTPLKNVRLHGMYSTLELESFPLDSLTREEIRLATDQLFPKEWQQYFKSNPANANLLTKSIHRHSHSFDWMEFVCKQLIRARKENIPFPKRLKHIQKEFDTLHKPNLERKIISGKKNVQKHAKAAGIATPKWNLLAFIKQLIQKGDD